jgi:hypothetical protein
MYEADSRYRLLESTRLYVLGKLSGVELAKFQRRHATWVADFASWVYDSSWLSSEGNVQQLLRLSLTTFA